MFPDISVTTFSLFPANVNAIPATFGLVAAVVVKVGAVAVVLIFVMPAPVI